MRDPSAQGETKGQRMNSEAEALMKTGCCRGAAIGYVFTDAGVDPGVGFGDCQLPPLDMHSQSLPCSSCAVLRLTLTSSISPTASSYLLHHTLGTGLTAAVQTADHPARPAPALQTAAAYSLNGTGWRLTHHVCRNSAARHAINISRQALTTGDHVCRATDMVQQLLQRYMPLYPCCRPTKNIHPNTHSPAAG